MQEEIEMDRKPKPAPFKVGTQLRYIGGTRSWTYDINPTTKEKKEVPIQVPGMIVEVAEIRKGRRGTLVHLRDETGEPMYYEDTGEPILDDTDDGYSVYYVEAYQHGKKQGRCIHPENVAEWEIVA
jgi:hypothetical protein